MADNDGQTVSSNMQTDDPKQDGGCVAFFQEKHLFGNRKPSYTEYVKHEEMYNAMSKTIDASHITGLQRINGMWRLYFDNVADKATLMATGITLRGRVLPILPTNPLRLDGEMSTRIRIQNIPLSVDDGTISRTLTLKGLEVITTSREKLRIGGKLTNCETGDRIVIVKSSTLKDPLPRFMSFGKFKAKVIHKGQIKPVIKCSKCLEVGHNIQACTNDWMCTQCNESGHKRGNCPLNDDQSTDDDRDEQTHSNTPANQEETKRAPRAPIRVDRPTNGKSPKRRKNKPRPMSHDPRDTRDTGKSQQLLDKFIKSTVTPDTPTGKSRPTKYVHSPPTPDDSDTRKKRNED